MSKIEKMRFIITTLELIVFGIGKRSIEKRNRDFIQRYYGVSTVDELIQRNKESYVSK